MRSYLLRNVDRFMNFIDSASKFWAVVVIMAAILIFGPICLNIFLK